jgi:hypothetical protein
MLFLCAVLAGQAAFAASLALAANPQDEQTVRNAYAKLAYAVQSHTVYDAVRKNPDINSLELTKELQANELRFDIAEMSSGPLSEIASKPYTDFVTPPDTQVVLQISRDEEYFDENGKRVISNFAIPRWAPGEAAREGWSIPVQNALTQSGNGAKFSRYVTAAITVRLRGQSRTYHTLWLFGSDTLAIDLVSGDNVVTEFVTENVFPSRAHRHKLAHSCRRERMAELNSALRSFVQDRKARCMLRFRNALRGCCRRLAKYKSRTQH